MIIESGEEGSSYVFMLLSTGSRTDVIGGPKGIMRSITAPPSSSVSPITPDVYSSRRMRKAALVIVSWSFFPRARTAADSHTESIKRGERKSPHRRSSSIHCLNGFSAFRASPLAMLSKASHGMDVAVAEQTICGPMMRCTSAKRKGSLSPFKSRFTREHFCCHRSSKERERTSEKGRIFSSVGCRRTF